MKKFLLLAGVVAAMASCTKSEVAQIDTDALELISFSTYTGAYTKASDITSANITSGYVGVYAVMNGDTDLSDPMIPNTKLTSVEGSTNLNTGSEDEYDEAVDGQWTSSESYYWPSGGKLYDFYAYYPFVGTEDEDVLTDGILVHDDLKLSYTAVGQVDILAGGNTTISSQTTVLLTLEHMLAKVDFQIGLQSEKAGSAIEVEIHDIQLVNIASDHGGLDLINSEFSAPAEDQAEFTAYTYGGASADGASFDIAGIEETYYSNEGEGTTNTWTPDSSFASSCWTLSDSDVFGLTDAATVSGDGTSLLDANSKRKTTSYYSVDAHDGTEVVDAFKLLPQTLENQQLSLTYSITQNGVDLVGTGSSSYKYTKEFDLKTSDIEEWESGKSYLYTISFIAEGGSLSSKDAVVVEFDVEVDVWPGDTTDATIPDKD